MPYVVMKLADYLFVEEVKPGLPLEPLMAYCQPGPREQKLPWFFNQNTHIFFQEDAFENAVCKLAVNLFRGPFHERFFYRASDIRQNASCIEVIAGKFCT